MSAPETRPSPPLPEKGRSNGNGERTPVDPIDSGPKALPLGMLGEDAWLRRFASSLTRDSHLAEDVVQNAYLAALRSPPRDPDRRRAWLRTVVRNFVRLSHRESSRRGARERVVAREESVPSPESYVEEAELRGLVARAVATLEEPYRSTVIEHFYRGTPTRDIANSEGVAPNTIRVRIRRAIGQLSRSLDHRCAGKRAMWLLPLLAFFIDPAELAAMTAAADDESAVSSPAGASSPIARAFIPVAVVAVLMIWIAYPSDRPGEGGFGAPAGTLPPGAESEDRTARRDEGRSPSGETGQIAPVAQGLDLLPRAVLVRNRETGAPIAGAEVFLDPVSKASERLARGRTPLDWLTQPFATRLAGRTDQAGRIALPPESLGRDRLLVRAPGFAEYRERAALRIDTDGVLEIALRPAGVGRLTVRLPGGSPAADVAVRVVGASGRERSGVTDRAGLIEYSLEESEHAIEIDLEGYAAVRSLALPPEQSIELAPASMFMVRCTDARGGAVSGTTVRVRLSDRTEFVRTADRTGSIGIPVPEAAHVVSLTAEHPSHPSTRVELSAAEDLPAEIALRDPTWVEGEVSGPTGPVDAGTVLAIPEGPFFARDLMRASIDETGRFHLGPLPAGTTRLRVESPGLAPVEIDVEDLRAFETRPIDCVLLEGTTLTGIVVTPEGAPLPGVRLQLGAVFGDEIRGPIVVSGLDGRFSFTGISTVALPVRATIPETRWTAFGSVDALPRDGHLLEVLRPHQLRSLGEETVPRMFFLGSRNTVSLENVAAMSSDPDLEIVVDPLPAGRPPRVELVDADGMPVRDVINWLVLPPEDPSDRSLLFAGTDGNPVMVGDPTALQGSWIAMLAREHTIPGGLYTLTDNDAFWTLELRPRVERELVFRHDDGTPLHGADLWWVPDDPAAFAAIALGRTDEAGHLVANFLAPGRYRILLRPTDGDPAEPTRRAIAISSGSEIGVLVVPPTGDQQIVVRVSVSPGSR